MDIKKLCHDIADDIEDIGHYQEASPYNNYSGVCILTSPSYERECYNPEFRNQPHGLSTEICKALNLFRPEVNYTPGALIIEFNDSNKTEFVLEALRAV